MVEYGTDPNGGQQGGTDKGGRSHVVSILGQYCINVRDLERAIEFWNGVCGLPVISRTDIPQAKEAILQSPHGGSRMQLAQQLDNDAPDRHGHRDVEALREHRRRAGALRRRHRPPAASR